MQKNRLNVALSLVLTVAICLSFVTFLPTAASAANSADSYYSGITATEGTALLGQLHDLITTTHTKYTSYDDCKNPTYVMQTDAGSSSSYVMEFYSQADISSDWGGGAVGTWNREHVWCQSLSNGLWGTTGGGSDLHHIRPVESTLNSARGNNKFGEVSNKNSNTEAYYKDGNKEKVALGGYNSGGVFEPLDQVKGDVARILMYLYTHYNTYSNVYGTTNGNGSASFGTLNFTNIISASDESAAIELLLEWNRNDPVDSTERSRNEAVYSIQGNRNPFIDNETYADAIWGGQSLQTDPLQSLSINYSELTLSAQQTISLEVTATPSNANSRVTWSSSNSGVATVSSAGVVTGVSTGTATITATSVENSNITAKCTVTVKGITGITISGTPSKTTYTEGEEFDPTGLTVKATYNDGTTANLPLSSCTWLDGTTQSESLSQGTTSVVCKVGNLTATVNGITVKADTSVPQPVDMTNLQENTPYKLTLKQGSKNDTILYIKNEVANSYYMASTEDPSESDDVYIEIVSGGFRMYFLNGSTKNYLNAEVNGTHVNLVSRTSATSVWQYDSANECIKTAVTVSGNATEAYIGTYDYYTTFSTSTIDHLSGSFPAYLTSFSEETTSPEDSVTLDKTAITLEVGATSTLTATASGAVSWSTSNSAVATVSSSGKVTAVGSGTATITATSGTATATCTVTVKATQVEDSVTLDKIAITLEVGATSTLNATASGAVVWTSSDESIAIVSSSGKVTAVGSGTATITATSGTATATCTVTVKATQVEDYVTLDKTAIMLEAGETSMLTATANGAVVWTSSDESIATVSSSGKVTAVGSGTATITATSGTATATCTVTVKATQVEDYVTLDKTAITLEAGENSMLTATASGAVVWTSSDESIATVSSSGKVTAVGSGTATITATCGTATATCTVSVTEETNIAAFTSAMAQVENATAFDAKYQALQQAISAYSKLSQNAKNSVQEDFAKLQNEVNSYNEMAARYNADSDSALSNVLTTAATTLGLAAAALVVLLKQKLL